MTFTEQLSAAAEKYELDVICVKAPNVSFDFAQGARWCLNSELVRELSEVLDSLVMEIKLAGQVEPGEYQHHSHLLEAKMALQKLKEARGGNK